MSRLCFLYGHDFDDWQATPEDERVHTCRRCGKTEPCKHQWTYTWTSDFNYDHDNNEARCLICDKVENPTPGGYY